MRSPLLRPIAAAAAVIAMVAIGSCAKGPAPADPEVTPAAATIVPLPPALAATSDVEARNEQVTDLASRSFISYPTLPTDPSLQDALRAAIDGARKNNASLNAGNAAPAGGLSVTWQIAAAAGSMLGVRVQTSTPTDTGGAATTSMTWYGDARSQKAWPSRDLIRSDALPRIATAAVAAFRDAGVITRTPTVDPLTLVRDVVFDPDGSLTLTIPEGAIAPRARGRLAVRLSPDLTGTVLTSAGATVQAAITSAAPITRALPALDNAAPAPPAAKPPLDTRQVQDCSVQQCVALTFDDGPGPYTMALLDELDAAGVKATFFVVGQNVQKHPEIVAAEVARGHEVGGHSWSHSYLTKMPLEQVATDTQQTSTAIANAGGTPPPFLRPPYGAKNQAVLDTIGVPAILWSVDTLDWQNRDVAQTTANALAGAQPGSIILFHDIHESTVQAIPGIIAELRARGLTPVTVTQLFAGVQLTPGHTYGSRSY